MPLVLDGSMVRWQPGAAAPVRVTYGFATGDVGTPRAVNCAALQSFQRLYTQSNVDEAALRWAAEIAARRWRAVAGIDLVEAAAHETPDITIGEQRSPTGTAFADVTPDRGPTSAGQRAILSARICLNPDKRWKIGFDGNLAVFDLVHTLTHEFGHAIGLDHPGRTGALMSFKYDERHDGLTAGDIEGAVALYGPAR